MNGLPLSETDKERVIMDTRLKPSKQCAEAARRVTARGAQRFFSRVYE